MNRDDRLIREAMLHAAHAKVDGVGIVGYGTVVLLDGDGDLKQVEPFANLITNAGDQYYSRMGIALVSPAAAAQPTKASGMKLGTGTNSTHKSTQYYASLQTYISGSNNPFDASYPQYAAVGTDVGYNAVYRTTWAAGDVINSAITEAAIVNDGGTDATTTVANTYARTTFTAINKSTSDSLEITWNHKFLGA